MSDEPAREPKSGTTDSRERYRANLEWGSGYLMLIGLVGVLGSILGGQLQLAVICLLLGAVGYMIPTFLGTNPAPAGNEAGREDAIRRITASLDRMKGGGVLKTSAVVLTAGVCLGLFPMPYGYYMLLRIAFFVPAIIGLSVIAGKLNNAEGSREWGWAYAALAVLYNPFFPIHFGDKGIWMILNIATLAIVWVGVFKFQEPSRHA